MSLYHNVCGVNPLYPALLDLIKLSPDQIPRFRDVWVNPEFTELTVHTRTGGGNRPDYEKQNAVLQAHPLYLRDSDDTFDSTFANFVFRLPQPEAAKLKAHWEKILSAEDVKRIMDVITRTSKEKWDAALAALGKGEKK